jgi:hypothetical protein
MASPFYTMIGDTTPLAAQLLDDDGAPVNLGSGTVTFTMVGPDSDPTKVVNAQTVTVTGASTGLVSYPFTALQTATAGTYKAYFTATVSSVITTYPKPEALVVIITGKPGDV